MSDAAPRAALNLSGQITARVASRALNTLPPFSGRIITFGKARLTAPLILSGGRTKASVRARVPGTTRLAGRIKGAISTARVAAGGIAISGRITTAAKARAPSTVYLAGRVATAANIRAVSTVFLFGRINSAISARAIGTSPVLAPQRMRAVFSTARADPLYLMRPFAGRIKAGVSGARGSVFVLPVFRGRIATRAQIRAIAAPPGTITARNLAGRIKTSARARLTATASLIGTVITATKARLLAATPFGGLAGQITATVGAGANLTVPVTQILTGLITTTARARATPAPAGTIFLFGRISARAKAGAATSLTTWLTGRTATAARLVNRPIQPRVYLIGGTIITAVQAQLLRSELLEPLPPYPRPYPTQPLEHYLDLITSEHISKPKYLQTVTVTVDPYVDEQALIASVPGLFDLDYSHGEQEDFTGQWVGKSRWIELPNVFFSFDIEGLGWNQANWKGPLDSNDKLQRLDDYHYRLLLYATVIANHWDGSVPKAYEAWDTLFHWTGLRVVIQDYGDMTMIYGLLWDSEPDTVLLSLFTSGQMDLKPEGIELISYVFQYEPGAPLFGFDAESDAIAGWDEGSWGYVVQPGSGYTPILKKGDAPA